MWVPFRQDKNVTINYKNNKYSKHLLDTIVRQDIGFSLPRV